MIQRKKILLCAVLLVMGLSSLAALLIPYQQSRLTPLKEFDFQLKVTVGPNTTLSELTYNASENINCTSPVWCTPNTTWSYVCMDCHMTRRVEKDSNFFRNHFDFTSGNVWNVWLFPLGGGCADEYYPLYQSGQMYTISKDDEIVYGRLESQKTVWEITSVTNVKFGPGLVFQLQLQRHTIHVRWANYLVVVLLLLCLVSLAWSFGLVLFWKSCEDDAYFRL